MSSSRRQRGSVNPIAEAYLNYCHAKNLPQSVPVMNSLLANPSQFAQQQPGSVQASTISSMGKTALTKSVNGPPSAAASRLASRGGGFSNNRKNEPTLVVTGVDIQLNADLLQREDEWEGFFHLLRSGTGIDGLHLWSSYKEDVKKASAQVQVRKGASAAVSRPPLEKGKPVKKPPQSQRRKTTQLEMPAYYRKLPDLAKYLRDVYFTYGYHYGITCRTIRDTILASKTLVVLELAGIQISVNSAKLLSGAIEKSVSLRKLLLPRSAIGDAGLSQLATGLRLCRPLEVFSVAGSELTKHCASIITDVIKWTESLRDDLIEEQQLRQAGGTRLNNRAQSMKRIDLNRNSLGDLGAIVLGESVRDPVGLRAIDLQFNSIGDYGAAALYKLVVENRDIILLDLRNNPISPALLQKIELQLLKNAQNLYHRMFRKSVQIPDLAHISATLNDPELELSDGRDPLAASFHPIVKKRTIVPPTFPKKQATPKRALSAAVPSKTEKQRSRSASAVPSAGHSYPTAKPRNIRIGAHSTSGPASARNRPTDPVHDPHSTNPLGCNCVDCQRTLHLWQQERHARMETENRLLDLERIISSLTALFRRGANSVDSAGSDSLFPSRRDSPDAGFISPAMLLQDLQRMTSRGAMSRESLLQGAENELQSPDFIPSNRDGVALVKPEQKQFSQDELVENMADAENQQPVVPLFGNMHKSRQSIIWNDRVNVSSQKGNLPANLSQISLSAPLGSRRLSPSGQSHMSEISSQSVERFERLLDVMENSMAGFNHLLDRLEKNSSQT